MNSLGVSIRETTVMKQETQKRMTRRWIPDRRALCLNFKEMPMMNMIRAITPIAKNPGISRTECSQPMSAPSNFATSITKLFNSADHVAKATGIAIAITNKSAMGLRQNGKDGVFSRRMICMESDLRPFKTKSERDA